VIRGYLGVATEDVVQIVGEEVAGEPPSGARIVSVRPGTPAAAAGLVPGDIIVEYAGRPVESRRDLQFLIADTPPGNEVSVGLIRGGGQVAVAVTPVEWTDDDGAAPARADGWLGLEVASLAGADPRVVRLKQTLGVTATDGIMAVAVKEDSPAAEAGIRAGDVLVSIEEHELTDPAAWEQARTLLGARRDPLTVLVRTGTSERYVSVQPRPTGIEN
jgi:serine protease Do